MGYFILLAVPIWIYFDLKKFRGRGVPVSPGGIASVFLIISVVAVLFAGFQFTLLFGHLPSSLFYTIGPIADFILQFLVPLGIYLLLRTFHYQKLARLGNPPLPTPRFSFGNIIFILLLGLPLLAIAAASFLFSGRGFYMF